MNSTGSGAPVVGGGAHGPGQHCPSDLTIDAWLTGHATPDDGRRVETAQANCDDCREHFGALDEQRALFLDSPAARHLETRLLASARERRARAPFWRRWQAAFAGVGVAAAAAVALVLTLGPPPEPTDPGALEGAGVIGLKGGPIHLETFVQRDGAVLRLGTGDAVRAGDAIGFRVTMGQAGWVAVFGTDRGRPVAIVPPSGDAAHHVEGGEATQLPASAVLDATGSRERFAVVSCPDAFPVEAARDALASWAQNGEDRAATDAVRRALTPTCELRVLTFSKP
jgi:hypothetical protein